jgi:hypothetical protein
VKLTPTNLAQGIYTQGALDYVENGGVQNLTGALNTWPNASNSPSGAFNYWTTGSGAAGRTWRLETTLTTNVTGATPPIFTQNDFDIRISVNYATPVPTLTQSGVLATTTNEIAFLERCREVRPGDILIQRRISIPNAGEIRTTFYWPNDPPAAAGYTAPLVRFVETRITGLTTEPIVLSNYFSQTYRPGHHNFTEEFIFEPRLEPGLAAATLAELNAANIQWIHVKVGFADPVLNVLGLDQKLRRL